MKTAKKIRVYRSIWMGILLATVLMTSCQSSTLVKGDTTVSIPRSQQKEEQKKEATSIAPQDSKGEEPPWKKSRRTLTLPGQQSTAPWRTQKLESAQEAPSTFSTGMKESPEKTTPEGIPTEGASAEHTTPAEPKTTKNYKEIFKKDVFFGDSLTDSLSYYGFLDEKNVIAKLGLNLTSAKMKLPAVIKAQPEHLYLLFGSNDVEIGGGTEKFVKKYKDMVEEIQESLPDTIIHIQSILPVMAKKDTADHKLNNHNIDLYNEALRQMCQEQNWSYVDINTIAKENPQQFEPDAIHVKASFYPLWLDLAEKVRKETP